MAKKEHPRFWRLVALVEPPPSRARSLQSSPYNLLGVLHLFSVLNNTQSEKTSFSSSHHQYGGDVQHQVTRQSKVSETDVSRNMKNTTAIKSINSCAD